MDGSGGFTRYRYQSGQLDLIRRGEASNLFIGNKAFRREAVLHEKTSSHDTHYVAAHLPKYRWLTPNPCSHPHDYSARV
jgi:hypothetical protein